VFVCMHTCIPQNKPNNTPIRQEMENAVNPFRIMYMMPIKWHKHMLTEQAGSC